MSEDEDKMDEKEFYLNLIREIVDDQRNMIGNKVAMQKARASPLEIDKDDEITGFYGRGENVLNTISDKYGEVWGEKVARRKMRRTVRENVDEEHYELVPDYMVPEQDSGEGIVSRLMTRLRG